MSDDAYIRRVFDNIKRSQLTTEQPPQLYPDENRQSTEERKMKYRKKPIVIEAIRIMEPNTQFDVQQFCPTAKICGVGAVGEKVWVEIPTLEGTMRAEYGDWIIRGVQGEYYPCKSDIFEQTYESVEE